VASITVSQSVDAGSNPVSDTKFMNNEFSIRYVWYKTGFEISTKMRWFRLADWFWYKKMNQFWRVYPHDDVQGW
jgi:hypothetical protein